MAVTVGTSYVPVVGQSQPSSTTGLVRRDIINFASTGSQFAVTAANISASGLAGIVSVSGIPLGTTACSLASNNTTNGDGTIDFSTGTLTLTSSSTAAGQTWALTIISRS